MSKPSARRWSKVGELFDRVVELPPGERAAALAAARAGEKTRRQVQGLLAALEQQGDFLEQRPALTLEPAEAAGYSSLAVGDRVGAFEIERLIGRGGMGEVYLALRADSDFVQHVALKLIRPEAVGQLAHFENERRILAALDHPGIARLVDGGLTPDGRPYMAMEYVDGRDIISWAQAHSLDLEARLRLFCEVCSSVDFAHRNLIVHRDIKPANILVTGEGRAKLLDFGIARLVAENGTPAQTQALLTPDYAAPEQLDGGAITMATDVYALGLLLYELLTGQSPWRLKGLLLPSTLTRRLEADPTPPSVAAKADSPVPARRLQGDLDAIVLKALRREPARRYQSASRLRNDVERHLLGDAVQARGDSRSYRLQRFVSRYRVAVGATLAVFLALAAGLVGVAWQVREVARERDQVLVEVARAEAVREYLVLMFRTAGENAGTDSLTAKQVLDESARRLANEYRDEPRMRAELLETLGSLYSYMNDYEGAAPLLREYLASPEADSQPVSRAEITAQLAEVELRRGDTAEARRLLDQAQAYWNRDPGRFRQSLVNSRQLQAQIEKEESGLPQSIRTLQAALLEHDDYFGRQHTFTANLLNSLGNAYQANGDIEKADAAYRDAWAVHEALGKTNSANALLTLGNWATVAFRKKDLASAEDRMRRASTLRRQLYGPSAALAAMQGNLGKVMLRAGKSSEAMPLLLDSLAMSRQFTGDQSPLTIVTLQTLTEAHIVRRDFDEAAATLAQARDAARANSGEDQVLYAICDGLEARLLLARRQPGAAREFAEKMGSKLTALGDAGAPHKPEVERLLSEIAAATP